VGCGFLINLRRKSIRVVDRDNSGEDVGLDSTEQYLHPLEEPKPATPGSGSPHWRESPVSRWSCRGLPRWRYSRRDGDYCLRFARILSLRGSWVRRGVVEPGQSFRVEEFCWISLVYGKTPSVVLVGVPSFLHPRRSQNGGAGEVDRVADGRGFGETLPQHPGRYRGTRDVLGGCGARVETRHHLVALGFRRCRPVPSFGE